MTALLATWTFRTVERMISRFSVQGIVPVQRSVGEVFHFTRFTEVGRWLFRYSMRFRGLSLAIRG